MYNVRGYLFKIKNYILKENETMKNLDLLIKLQNYYIELENNNKVLKDGSDIYFLKKLKDKI